jgi:hypothetical protein
MTLPDPSVAQSSFVSIVTAMLSASFALWLGKEAKTSVMNTPTSSKVEYDVDK